MARERQALGLALLLVAALAGLLLAAPARASFDCGTMLSLCSAQIDDSGRVWFASDERLTEDAPGEGDGKSGIFQIYERTGNRTVLVSRYPDGWPIVPDGGRGSAARLLGVSRDGERVFLQTDVGLVPSDVDGASDGYVLSGGRYTLLTAGSTGSTPTTVRASLLWASDDGRYAYFGTAQQLVPADRDSGWDVYQRFAGQTRLVSTGPDQEPPDLEHPGWQAPQPWYLGAGLDGSTAYFATAEHLTAGDDGKWTSDIFSWRDGVTTRLTHTVSPEDVPGTPSESFGLRSFARGAADGSLYFTAHAPQVPEDTDANADVYRVRPDGALERVIATAGLGAPSPLLFRPEVVSRDGSRIFLFSDAQLAPGDHDQKADVYMWTEGRYELVSVEGESPRGEDETTLCAISDNGHRAYLETWARLSPDDLDAQKDVYEWHDGELRLVSPAGEGREGPALCAGISPNGRYVAFTTWEELVPGDADGKVDTYVIDMGAEGAAAGGAPAGASAVASRARPGAKTRRKSHRTHRRRRLRLVTAEAIPPRMRTAAAARLRGDRARLRLRCPKSERSGPCRGRVQLLARGSRRVLAAGWFRIAAGRARAVVLKGRRLPRRSRPVLARVRAADQLGNRRTVTAGVRLRRVR